MTPSTLSALQNVNDRTFKERFDALEAQFYRTQILLDPSQKKFENGWMKRVLLARVDEEETWNA